MRGLTVTLFVLVLLFPAAAGASTDPQVAALKRQVAALSKQVKTLNRAVTSLRLDLSVNYEGDTCLGAQTADLIQSTWLVIDQVASRSIFGAQTGVSDFKNCADLANPDVPRVGIQAAPTIAPFLPMMQWLHVTIP